MKTLFSKIFLAQVITVVLALLGVVLIAAYVWMLLEDFVIPIMHRDSLTTTEAWVRFGAVHRGATGMFLLYFLWKFLLSIVRTRVG